MKNMTDAKIMELISQFQQIQKQNKCDSIEWLRASKELHVLFREMASRSKAESE